MSEFNRSSYSTIRLSTDTSSTLSTTPEFNVYQTYAERQLISSLLALISIVAFFGNSVVVISVILSKKLRTVTNAFVVNLSVADLFTALNLPWLVIGVLSVDGWPLPDQLCVLCAFMLVCCLGCSATTLACIAFNRLILITRPKSTFRWLYTRKKVGVMLMFTWGLPVAVAFVPMISPVGELGYDARYSTCSWKTSNPNSELYSILVSVAFYPTQLLVIIVCYVLVIRHLQKHTKRIVPEDAPASGAANMAGENRAKVGCSNAFADDRQTWQRICFTSSVVIWFAWPLTVLSWLFLDVTKQSCMLLSYWCSTVVLIRLFTQRNTRILRKFSDAFSAWNLKTFLTEFLS